MKKLCGLLSIVILLLSTTLGATTEDILISAEAGDLDSVKVLLEHVPSLIEATDDGGYTPLHKASYAGHEDVVNYLLGLGANVNAASNSGSTPLHGAAYYGHQAAMESLVEAGADINIQNNGGYTPLLSAMAGGQTEIAIALIRHGADPNVTTSDGQTILMSAVLSGSKELTELILSRDPDLEATDSYDRTALLLNARESGNAVITELLIDAGANIDAKDKFDSTPLELASWRGFSGIVNLLLDRGVKFPTDLERLNQLLTYSTEKGLPRLFTEVIARGADISDKNPNDGSYLHSAATGGNAEIVQGLLEQDLQVNERDKYGWMALHYAVSRGRQDVTRLLLDKGADINAVTNAGYTPLSIARDYEHDELVKLLLQKGAKDIHNDFITLEGPYFGQTTPGDTPVWFAPDIVSSNRFEHSNVAFSLDGTEAFWSSSFALNDSGYTWSRMMTSHIEKGSWTKPVMALFSSVRSGDDAPFYNADGSKLYFVSMRPTEEGGESTDFNLWVVDRTDHGWSDASLASAELNEIGDRSYRSMAANSNLYASGRSADFRNSNDIFISRFSEGRHLSPEKMGVQINSTFDEHACIAPDESYMIIQRMGHPDGFGDADLFVSFRDIDGRWTTSMILPEPINSSSRDWYPYITMDGKYMIFNSHRGGGADYYWVSTNAITAQKENALRKYHATRPIADGISLRRCEQVFEPVRTNSVGLGDLDGDHDLDLVCSNMGENDSRVWLNDGRGRFTVTDQILTRGGHGISLKDVDVDGDLDIFITFADYIRRSTLYLNDGFANFENSGVDLEDSMFSGNKLEMHDLDSDGDQDVIIQYYQEDDGVYFNDGRGGFTRASFSIPESSTWGDLDGDGDIDILARDLGVGFKTFLNDGSANFSAHWEKLDSAIIRGYIGLVDLDNDGDLDAVVGTGGNEENKPTEVWYNDGSGEFRDSGKQLPVTMWGRFACGDLNNDGYPDVFVTNFGMPDYVWLNDGNGNLFDTGLRLGGYGTTINPAIGDIDNDGDLDLFVPDFIDGANVIWFNELK
jgi:ankyrin repeat protein